VVGGKGREGSERKRGGEEEGRQKFEPPLRNLAYANDVVYQSLLSNISA